MTTRQDITSPRARRQYGCVLHCTVALLFLTGILGCTPISVKDLNATNEARVAATPKARPERTITNFTRALQCMDELFVRYNISDLLVGAQDVIDPTAKQRVPTKDMLISALSSMSQRSKAIKFVVLGYDLQDISTFHNLHKNRDFRSPDFFIRISSPQMDKAVSSTRYGGGIRVEDAFSAEISKDRLLSIVSMDMNLGVVKTLQMLPGLSSSNSIAFIRKGFATDFSGTFKKFGALFQVSFDQSEGINHTLRTLVELGAIELMGSLSQVPYWECLDIESNSPLVQDKIHGWFKSLSDKELRLFVQSKLEALGYYDGPIDGQPNDAFRQAIARYKGGHGLIADSNIDFALYYNLIADKTPIKSSHLPLLKQRIKDPDAPDRIRTIPQNIGLNQTGVKPLIMEVSTNRGHEPIYHAGELMSVRVNVTADAYVYCYYQQADGQIFKLFPNRYVPNPFIKAEDGPVFIPGGHFKLTPEIPNSTEQVMCMASYNNIDDDLPPELGHRNLHPVPVENLEAVFQYYKLVSTLVPLKKTVTIKVR